MVPPAPARLSITTLCFQEAVRCWPMARETVSSPPPGEEGTTMRIDLPGYGCATAVVASTGSSTRVRTRVMVIILVSFIATASVLLLLFLLLFCQSLDNALALHLDLLGETRVALLGEAGGQPDLEQRHRETG